MRNSRAMSRRSLLQAGFLIGGTTAAATILAACGEAEVVEKIITREVIVTQEVIKEVPVDRVVTQEVIKEVEVERVVTQEVQVEKIVVQEVAPQLPDTTILTWTPPYWKGVTGRGEDAESGAEDAYMKYIVGEFQKQFPQITVNFAMFPWDDYRNKIAISAATGAGHPDTIQDGSTNIRRYALKGFLEPVDRFLSQDDLDDFLTLEQGEVLGKRYGIPQFVTGTSLVSNRRLFEEAGAADLLPTDGDRNWNYEQFLEACRAITDPDAGRHAISFNMSQGAGDYYRHSFLWGRGAKMMSGSGRQYTFNSPEGVTGMTYLLDMFHEGLISPDSPTLGWGDTEQKFIRRQTAFVQGHHGSAQTYSNWIAEGQADADEIDVYPINYPFEGDNSGHQFSLSQMHALWQWEDDNRLQATVEWVRFLSNTENQRIPALATNNLPTRRSVGDLFAGDPYMDFMRRMGKYTAIDVLQPGYFALRAVNTPMYQGVMTDQSSPEEALNDAAAEGQLILDDLYEEAEG